MQSVNRRVLIYQFFYFNEVFERSSLAEFNKLIPFTKFIGPKVGDLGGDHDVGVDVLEHGRHTDQGHGGHDRHAEGGSRI